LKVTVHRLAMASPADVSGLQRLIDAGEVDPSQIAAVIGKTEGNGGANDFTRALATVSVTGLIADATGEPPAAVSQRVALIWSGGCEGVISPHMTVLTRDDSVPPDSHRGGLAVSVQRTPPIRPEEIGRLAEVDSVAAAAARALEDLGVEASNVHFVQVKGPLLTPGALSDAAARGVPVVTMDPNASKSFARGATALGVAVALGEVDRRALSDDTITRDLGLFSRVASTSAGGELTACEVLVLANSPAATSGLRIGHATLRDAIDASGVMACLRSAGLEGYFRSHPLPEERVNQIERLIAANKWRSLPEKNLQVLPDAAQVAAGNH
jgi:cyanuric acid amidohydrolase